MISEPGGDHSWHLPTQNQYGNAQKTRARFSAEAATPGLSGANALPRLDPAGPSTKQGMALRRLNRSPLAKVRWTAQAKLPEQVPPLMRELSRCYGNRRHVAHGANLGTVKSIAAARCFSVNGAQVRGNGGPRRCMGLEPLQLGMMPVAPGQAPKHCTGQQRLAPQRDEPLRIEVAGMDGPQPHGNRASGTYSGVVGSMTVATAETRVAGKPPSRACSRTVASSGATYMQ